MLWEDYMPPYLCLLLSCSPGSRDGWNQSEETQNPGASVRHRSSKPGVIRSNMIVLAAAPQMHTVLYCQGIVTNPLLPTGKQRHRENAIGL